MHPHLLNQTPNNHAVTDYSTLLHQQVLQSMPVAVIGTTPAEQGFLITTWNKAAETLYGWTSEEAMGRPVSDVVKTVFQSEPEKDGWQDFLAQQGSFEGEVIQRRKDGTLLFIQTSVSHVRNDVGAVVGVVAINQNLTEQRQLRPEAIQQEPTVNDVVSQLNVGIASCNKNGKFLYANHRFCAITGYDEQELLQKRIKDITHPDDIASNQTLFQQCLQLGTPFSLQKRYLRKDGAIAWVNVSVSRTGIGEDAVATAACIEITQQKDIAQDLAYQKQLLETVTGNTDMALFLMDDQQYCAYMNQAAEQMTGFSLRELKGKQLHYHIHHTHPDGRHYPLEECPIDQALPTQRRMKGEEVFVRKDGSFYPVAFTASPIIVEGKAVGTVIEVRETTEEKRKEQAQRESEDRFKILVRDATAAIVVLTGPEMKVDIVNQAYANLIAGTPDDLMGKPLFSVIPDAEPYYRPILEKVLTTGEAVVLYDSPYQVNMSGQLIEGFLHVVYQPYRNTEGEIIGVLAILQDVTEAVKAKQALKESESKFRHIIDSNIIGVLFWDLDKGIVDANAAFLNLLGFSRQDLENGLHWDPITPERWRETDRKSVEELLRTGQTLPFEKQYIHKNGELVDVIVANTTFEGTDNRRGVTFVLDITERKKLEAAVRQGEERVRNFIMQAPVAMGLYQGPELVVEIANEALLSFWGKTSDQVLNRPVFEAVPEAKGQGYEELFQQVLRTGKRYAAYGSPVLLPRNGEIQTVYVDIVYEPYFETDGTVSGIVEVVSDVTEQITALQKLRSSEELFRQFSDNLQNLAWMADADGWIYWYNQRWYDYTGTSFDEMQGWGWEKVHHPEHRDRVISFVKVAWSKKEPWELTFPLRGADGQFRWFLTRAVPILDDDGTILRWIGTNTNVDDHIQTQEKLTVSNARFRNILEQAPDPILVLKGEDLRLDIANDPLFRLWQIDQSALGKPFLELLPEMKEQGFYNMLMDVYRNGKTIKGYDTEVFFDRGSGIKETVYFNFVYTPYREVDSTISGVLVIATDVTGSVLARRQLVESESRFRTLAESLPQMIWMNDASGINDYYSHKWQEYSGFDNLIEAWKWMVHPSEWDEVMQSWQNHYAAQQPFRCEVRLRNKKGEYRWHQSVAEPLLDENGKLVKWIGVVTDIHAQKTFAKALEMEVELRTAELAKTNRELQRSNEDLQQFAHVASHDMKEPVRKVMTFGNRLRHEYREMLPPKAQTYLDKIESAALRSYAMIDGVLLYSSISNTESTKVPVDINTLLNAIETDLEVAMGQKGASLQYGHLPTVQGAPAMLHQLFYNLVGNALKFSKEGVSPIIHISEETVEWEDLRQKGLDRNRSFVKIVVSDNGIGFSPDAAEKIFGTFTRLHSKDNYEGTGLGLSLCKKIVERHGGAIWATGEEGNGATFSILLPTT